MLVYEKNCCIAASRRRVAGCSLRAGEGSYSSSPSIIGRKKLLPSIPCFWYGGVVPSTTLPLSLNSWKTEFSPINYIFDQIYVHKPDWNNFYKNLGKNYLTNFRKFLYMTSFWPPKWPNCDHFHQKWPILTKLTPINYIFDQIYVHKPDWNHF